MSGTAILEQQIRALPGVLSCSVAAGSVVVLVGHEVDASALQRRVATIASAAGMAETVRVLGGTRRATRPNAGRAAALRDVAPILAVVASVAAIVAAVVAHPTTRMRPDLLPPQYAGPAVVETVDGRVLARDGDGSMIRPAAARPTSDARLSVAVVPAASSEPRAPRATPVADSVDADVPVVAAEVANGPAAEADGAAFAAHDAAAPEVTAASPSSVADNGNASATPAASAAATPARSQANRGERGHAVAAAAASPNSNRPEGLPPGPPAHANGGGRR